MRHLYILLTLIFCLTFTPYSTPAKAEVFDPSDYYEIVVELTDPSIDPKDYSVYFLTQIDVPADQHYNRFHWEYRYALNGFSVYLTEDEYLKAERLDLLSAGDINSMTISTMGDFTAGPLPYVDIAGSPEMAPNKSLNANGVMPTTQLAPEFQQVPFGIQTIRAYNGYDQTTQLTDFSGVDVAVLDTGVDRDAPDLNVVNGKDCSGTRFDAPDFGFDGYGHGTHVAGTIAARDNGTGVVGVAPGARLWAIKVLGNDGRGSFASVLCGIDFVMEHADEIDVANMSLGGSGSPSACGGRDPMHNAICAATEKTIFVVAAGNASTDASSQSPANYPEVVTVSAYTDFNGQPGGGGIAPYAGCFAYSVDDELATFSNYGPDIDIAAPGVCILSTLPGSPDMDDSQYPIVKPLPGTYNPEYGYASGTSMASPHMAGCVAKYIAMNPDQAEYAVKQITTYSEAKNPPVKGDHDGLHEPLLRCDAVPRFEGSNQDYDG